MSAARSEPTPEQRAAAEPDRSVWVTASAGTGKTRVLADRVLRLLLTGVPSERLLGLTFTKAAAAEMLNRIGRDLGDWAALDDPGLAHRVELLTGTPPDTPTLARARSLFAQVLDLPSGLRIQTIHAFAQSLLRRFPLEAGVAPNFEPLDERSATARLRAARDAVLGGDSVDLAEALGRIAHLLDEERFGQALSALTRVGHGDDGEPAGLERLVARIVERLGVASAETVEEIEAEACGSQACDETGLARAAEVLAASDKPTDQKAAVAVSIWLQASPDRRRLLLPDYLNLFVKTNGDGLLAAKRVGTKAALAAAPDAQAALEIEQVRLLPLAERMRPTAGVELSCALLTVGRAILERYRADKAVRAELDFDDLILRARDLLGPAGGQAGWVNYKLDGAIDHVLVDEAQDTSPAQWRIVEGLVEEFFAGAGARPGERTLFVVGDAKQSIYSFQGADLAAYRDAKARLGGRVEGAGHRWHPQALSRSFRSTAPVLDLVRAVFEDERARQGVDAPIGPSETVHPDIGLIELWPLAVPPDLSELPEPPVDPEAVPDVKRELADAVVRKVRGLANGDEALATARTADGVARPVGFGDILVLLPRRSDFQGLLVRQMKESGIPVAGADRMVLTEQLAVMDLMALGDAVLLPEDDLTLAALLKSPLFGLDEAALFELCHRRGDKQSVVDRFRDLRGDLCFAAAWQRFERLRARADFVPPYEFFAEVLAADGGRRRLLERLGHDAVEPIEHFLALALAYECGHVPSLQGFLHWLRLESGEVKRDPDQPRDEVRVLTVHGAKGLEAPIVFLPDTTWLPQPRDLLVFDGDLPFWRGTKRDRDPVRADMVQREEQLQAEERNRLLYVALTRARERIYVGGWRRRDSKGETWPLWYDQIRAGLERLPATERVELDLGPHIQGEGLRLCGTAAFPRRQTVAPRASAPPKLPTWWGRPPPAEPVARPLAPSRQLEETPAADPPFGADDPLRFRRGRLVHRLLQILPELPPDARTAAAATYLDGAARDLDAAARADLLRQVEGVLTAPACRELFGPDSRAEVSLAGRFGPLVVGGQVDRLVVGPDAIVIADYKTGRSPPSRAEDVHASYRRQMAAYRAVLRQIYPGRPISCVLVWTETASVMPLPDDCLDDEDPACVDA